MNDNLIKIGDKVVIIIPEENRRQGYNPYPDGTEATVSGFTEIYYGRLRNFGIMPGVYENHACVKIKSSQGNECTESTYFLELSDQKEYGRRVEEFNTLQAHNILTWRYRKKFIRDLPYTPFWEGDIVRVESRTQINSDSHLFVVTNIDYNYLTANLESGTKYPAYKISDKINAGWSTSTSEDEMELVQRGPVWKIGHGEAVIFADIREEAVFFEMIGHFDEVKNPTNNTFVWTRKEVLRAIQEGLVHGFSTSRGLVGKKPFITAKRYLNEELGKRVAAATLNGSGLFVE